MPFMPLQRGVRHWIHAAVCGALAIPALLITVHLTNGLQQNRLVDKRMKIAYQQISENVGSIKMLLSSLVGLHQVSNQLEDQALLQFYKEITEHASYVSSVGRYIHVRHVDRADLERHMRQSGVFDFQIRHMNEQGKRSTLSLAEHYYPITILEPLQPQNARLLGADLASMEGLEESLDTITADNQSFLTTFPEAWPNGGQVVIIMPVYLGSQVPATIAGRQRQRAGGFWITVDLESFLAEIAGKLKDFDISVDIEQENSTKTLFRQEAHYDKKPYLHSLYPRQQFSKRWTTGNNSLVMRFETQTGYSGVVLLSLLVCAIALILMTTQLVARHRRRLQREFEREKDQYALCDAQQMAQRTLDAVQDAIITLDADLCISHINPAAVIQFNAKPSCTLGKTFDQVIQFQLADTPDTLFDLKSALQNLSHNSKGEFAVVPLGTTHSDFILNLTLSSACIANGDVTGHVIVMRNISQEYRLTAKLAYQANHDALTGCTNRYHFEQTLAGLIDELDFNQRQHALCYMDLDQFKVVNDTCGHRAGDRLLMEVSENMSTFLRNEDVLSRLGGDEFGLLLINVTPEQTKEISNTLYQFFQTHTFRHDGKIFPVRASIGVVQIDHTCSSMKEVMSAADTACLSAKESGRNSMYVYSPTDHTMAEKSAELSWLPLLQDALQNDRFELYLQPIASLDTLRTPMPTGPSIEHFEFLLRLQNPDGPDYIPWQFIRAAERYDLMRQIDRWVIRNALRTVAELKGGPGGQCSYSINLSGQSAADPTLKSFIQEQYIQYKPDPVRIWFELTETAAISHFSVATELFQSIRAMGSLIALDDFGTGMSSFAYLKNMPVDIIKIDGQFVREIGNDKIDRQMVLSIVQLGQVMGIKTVAEFVENQDILNELVNIGIDYAQGYHIGKPAPVAQNMTELFNQQRAA